MSFLQWALPRLGLRWAGFRKVRRQVCKRIDRRIRALGLADVAAYRAYVEAHGDEWRVLDALCAISISRFFRDRAVYGALGAMVLPELIGRAAARGDPCVRIWSAGCAAGEEPYSVRILWELGLPGRVAEHSMSVEIAATDLSEALLERARRGCYPPSSLREVPEDWRERAFVRREDEFCLVDRYRSGVRFTRQDLRAAAPPGRFDLILCRNLAFTYFDESEQRATAARLAEVLQPLGVLVIGVHESLPPGTNAFTGRPEGPWAFQRRAAGAVRLVRSTRSGSSSSIPAAEP